MKLFPYFLIRIAPDAYKNFEKLNLTKSYEIINELQKLNLYTSTIKNTICSELYNIIAKSNDSKLQNLLLNLKRDIYNDRFKVQNELSYIPHQIKNKLNKYIETKTKIDLLEKKGEEYYNSEIRFIRTHFKKLLNKNFVKNGLILSSQSLLKRLIEYRSSQEGIYSKSNHQTELSLMKYLSRIYMKTSPRSTFTNVGIGKLITNSKKNYLFRKKNKREATSFVKINCYLFKFFADILYKDPQAQTHLKIILNPTIELKKDEIKFLVNFNNIEAFQFLSSNTLIEFIYKLLISKKSGMSLKNLAGALYKEILFDYSKKEIYSYLQQLIEHGFLLLSFDFSTKNGNWDQLLFTYLRKMNSKSTSVKDISKSLKLLGKMILKYPKATYSDRLNMIHKTYTHLEKLHKKTPEFSETQEIFQFKPESIIYEDTKANIQLFFNEISLKGIFEAFDTLEKELYHLEGHNKNRKKLEEFFLKKYSLNAAIPILDFYENYSAYLRNNSEIQQEQNELKETNDNWMKRLTSIIFDENSINTDNIEIKYDHFKKTNLNAPKTPVFDNRYRFYGVLLQLFFEKSLFSNGIIKSENLKCVINNSFPGYGKMISRYLYMFNPRLTKLLKSKNIEFSQSDIFADISDASLLNVNIHPPLMDYEIPIPCGEQYFSTKIKKLSLSNLVVKLDWEKGILNLHEKHTNSKVYPFDLGLEVHWRRSELFVLLEYFTDARYLRFNLLLDAINRRSKNQDEDSLNGIHVRPRINYEKNIVLQRKAWIIPQNAIPHKKKNENDWSYFYRVTDWVLQYKIPKEVFIYISTNDKKVNNYGKEVYLKNQDHKPIYINFKNPILVNLFQKLSSKLDRELLIEEMLPNSEQLLKINKDKYVTEFIFQWSS